MSDQTVTAVEAAGFFIEYAGVRIIELDEGVYHLAYGHVDFEAFRIAINAYLAETVGDEQLLGVNAQHAWAVLRHAEGAAEDEGWYFTWMDITETTP
jgi:hypothetical protein